MITQAMQERLARGERVAVDYTEALSLGWLRGSQYPAMLIGPRVVGGVYRNAYWSSTYSVLSIRVAFELRSSIESGRLVVGPKLTGWEIRVRWHGDGRVTSHCTAWDYEHDKVIGQPALPRRIHTRARHASPKWRRVVLPDGSHVCSLCRPGIIGMLELELRAGIVEEAELMRAVDVIHQHNAYVAGIPGVSMVKAGAAR